MRKTNKKCNINYELVQCAQTTERMKFVTATIKLLSTGNTGVKQCGTMKSTRVNMSTETE